MAKAAGANAGARLWGVMDSAYRAIVIVENAFPDLVNGNLTVQQESNQLKACKTLITMGDQNIHGICETINVNDAFSRLWKELFGYDYFRARLFLDFTDARPGFADNLV